MEKEFSIFVKPNDHLIFFFPPMIPIGHPMCHHRVSPGKKGKRKKEKEMRMMPPL